MLGVVTDSCQAAGFVLAEQLGHEWTRERISFELTSEAMAMAAQNRALLGAGDEEVP